MMETQLGPEALALVGIIAVLVQQCKRIPYFVALKEKIPIFIIISLALGIAAAHHQEIENPIIAGLMMGLMAAGAYSATKTAS
jgi:hypothetical protein